jgi:hypothetical protein
MADDMICYGHLMKMSRNVWIHRSAARGAAGWSTRLAGCAALVRSQRENDFWRKCGAMMPIVPLGERQSATSILPRRLLAIRRLTGGRSIGGWARAGARPLKIGAAAAPTAKCTETRRALGKHVSASCLNPATDELHRTGLALGGRLFKFLLLFFGKSWTSWLRSKKSAELRIGDRWLVRSPGSPPQREGPPDLLTA